MSLKLKKFDPSTIGDNRTCIFIGKRGTGKTTLVTDILWQKRQIPVGIVMSGTEEGNGHYGNFVPDTFIYADYDRAVIDKVITRQRKLAVNKDDKVDKRVFLLLDDVMYDKKICREKCIRQLFMNGRHWNILLFATFQYVMDLPPDLRANVDYLFILRDNVITAREKLWKSFFGIIPDFGLFCTIMDKCTENYECLVLDNTKASNKIEDCVYWYKAQMRTDFKVGAREFWEYHKQSYNPSYGEEQAAPAAATNPKHRSTVYIQKVT
jgi:hypothetical protein